MLYLSLLYIIVLLWTMSDYLACPITIVHTSMLSRKQNMTMLAVRTTFLIKVIKMIAMGIFLLFHSFFSLSLEEQETINLFFLMRPSERLITLAMISFLQLLL